MRQNFFMKQMVISMFAGCLVWARTLSAVEPLPKVVEFNRDIRPILSDNCFACHGPDKNQRKAKLRLDTEAGAFGELDGKHPVVPKKTGESEMVRRITSVDPEEQMPPPDSEKKLSAQQIELIKLWIQQGAKWQGHWAYLPLQRAPIPKVKNKKWPRNPIDSFILAKLESKNLKPSPEADKRTLIRRLSFDLTGLPPSAEEVESFLADKSADAYEKVVDRLFTSPHFGERMAMRWLDLVRYADTVGYHGDQNVNIWPYRDYVINSFNANKPFDQFTVEQIAGDLLPEATLEQKIASGYNRLNMMTAEGGAQDKEYLAKYAADRVRTTSSVWLGSTLGCAECHDHKFDPFTTKDFYSFEAIFADLKEKGFYGGAHANGQWGEFIEVPSAQQAADKKRLDETIDALEKVLAAPTEKLRDAQKTWETKTLADLEKEQRAWLAQKPEKIISQGGATLEIQNDLSILASGENPAKDIYTITLRSDLPRVAAIRLEALTHESFPNKSSSRANGNFVLTGFEVEATKPGDAAPQKIKIAKATADYEQKDQPISATIDDKPETGWAVDGHTQSKNHQAIFIFAEPVAGGTNAAWTIRLKHESDYAQHHIGHFRLSLTAETNATFFQSSVPENILAVVKLPATQREEKQKAELEKFYLSIAPELAETRTQLAETKKQKEELTKKIPTTLVSVATQPREIKILRRGNWMDDGGKVATPAVPQFLPQPEIKDRRLTRLDLGKWLVSRDNPLTARAFVNRWWKLYFGTGLSKVLDDIGSQGEWPTHPELLDYLALDFMEGSAGVSPARGTGETPVLRWDVKHILKLMVTSSAYRQSSLADKSIREIDPFNRLLARQSRFRLDAEMVRDNALAISGLLSPTMFGRSAKPYQPAGYYAQLNFPKREYEADHGDNQYRRGVYTHWQRTFLHPMLMAFDAPSREECTVERPRSNTPLQSLTLLNDPTFVEAARVFAAKIIQQPGVNPSDRLRWAYKQALSRAPNKIELETLTALYEKHLEKYKGDRDGAQKLLKVGDSPAPKEMDAGELAAWTSVARTILNLHETITRF